MVRVKAAVFAGMAALFTTAAGAADMPDLYPPVHAPFYGAGGWYLRGDIGFTNQQVRDPRFNFIGAPPDSVDVVSKEFGTGGIFGIGLGYQFNNWLRIDITGEYRTPSIFHSFEIVNFAGTLLPEHNRLIKSEWVVLGNVYADLGTWYSITPFVGVGIGTANVRLSGFTDTVIADSTGTLVNANNSAPTGSRWNFAWAVHAGLAYRITPEATIEFAYRYLNLGDGVTGPISGFDGAPEGTSYELKGIDSHDLKFGVRWLLEPMRMPIVRKG
jgi:opacity protein-like surface antigen